MLRSLKTIVFITGLVFWASSAVAQERPRVVAVNQALHYFADRLLGDAAEVVFPVPEGTDPSFWRPSIADISAIQSADLILLNGAGFATWVDRVTLPRARVVNTSAGLEGQFIVTESITHSHGDGGEHSHEGLASYLWLDLTLAIAQAETIARSAIGRNLAPAADVEARLAELRSDLMDVDAKAKDALSALSEVAIIATHPRYQYLARRYDLNVASLEWDAGAMPDADQLSDLERLSAETGARILVWEATPPSQAMAEVEALGLQSVVFEPWAAQTAQGSFVEAYMEAISSLATAAR